MSQFDKNPDMADKVRPNRPPKPPPVEKPPAHPAEPMATTDDILSTSA